MNSKEDNMISRKLLLLLLCLWDELHETSGQYCVDQPSRTEMLKGKSVTIPCQFAFPNSKSIKSSRFIVKASADQNYCGNDDNIIYDSSKEISPKYRGRLNVTFHPNHRNASITITKEDGVKYCCRIQLSFIDNSRKIWQAPGGTLLKVKDGNEPSLETTSVIFAAPGDNVTILGHFTSNIVTSASNITCRGGRATGANTGCDHSGNTGICTHHNNSLSFQINRVTKTDQDFYCWNVNISTYSKEKTTYTYLGPQLLITDKTNNLKITQPEKVEIYQSATINCSFTVQQHYDILRMEVYWMTGDSRESYVYHPNTDYIHPDYKGRTRLVDGSNLHIEDFHGPDNTTIYCRVIIRRCLALLENNPPNHIETILEEGPGTRLVVGDRQICVDQLSRTESLKGKSVTIPCQFAFPKLEKSIKSSKFIVKASADGNHCGRDKEIIYDSDRKEISPKYRGRLNVTFHPNHRNASITIINITKEDGAKYCCLIVLSFSDKGDVQWQSSGGTQLLVKDGNEPSLETTSVIFAAPGDNVTILGHFTSNIATSASNITCRGGRATVANTGCDHSGRIGICTHHNNSLSFQINRVNKSDQDFYCWSVDISTNDEEKTTYTYLGPQLLITDKTNNLNITQPEEVEIYQSATINCSFTVQQHNNILRMEVYWMTGDSRESYVYHPNMDYIHQDYKGKTRLVDVSNLHIKDFHGPDNTTIYCRVIIRRCLEPLLNNPPNRIETILEEGPGTRLAVGDNKELSTTLTIILCVVAVFLIVFMSLACYFLKKRGIKPSNLGDTIVETTEVSDDQQEDYENMEVIGRPETVTGEELIYANTDYSERPPDPYTKTTMERPPNLYTNVTMERPPNPYTNVTMGRPPNPYTKAAMERPPNPYTKTVYAKRKKN